MSVKIRDVFLKMVPYLLSIAGGVTLYVLTADNIKNPNLADLINNIAASLLAIPLVFLLYDYSNYRVSKQLNKNMAATMSDKLNMVSLNLILLIRQMLGMHGKLTFESMNKMSNLSQTHIAEKLKITPAAANELRTYRNEIDDIMYNVARPNSLTGPQVQLLTAIARDVSLLINEHSFRRNRRVAARYIKNLIGKIIDWMDSDAFASMHFQELLGVAENDAANIAAAAQKDNTSSKN